MVKIIICGHYGFGNIGDEAILAGMKRFLSETWPNSEFVIWGKDKQFPFGFRSFLKAIFKPSEVMLRILELKECHLFIIGGGGLFTDEEGPFVSTNYILHGLLANLLRKKVFCLGVSIGRLKSWNKWLAKRLFRKAAINVVRDQTSADIVIGFGAQVLKMPDFAYLLQEQINSFNTKRPFILIVIRKYRNAPKEMYKNLAQVADAIIRNFGFDIRFIPFEPGLSNDELALNTIFDHMSEKAHAYKHNYTNSFNELFSLFSAARAAIVMRLHAGIFADIACTPFIPISYMDKVKNYWDGFGSVRPIQLNQISAELFLFELKKLLKRGREHRSLRNNDQFQLLANRLKSFTG